MRPRYTLLELIVVVAVLAILATGLALSIGTTCGHSATRRAQADIVKLKVAIAAYCSDTRAYPRPSFPRTTADGALLDGRDALAAALLAQTGKRGPYLYWEETQLRRTQRGVTTLLDPWGNPYHYREWASISNALKDDLLKAPPLRAGFVYPADYEGARIKQTQDLPHERDGFDIWSNGPNGINEYGDPFSDDVVSWR